MTWRADRRRLVDMSITYEQVKAEVIRLATERPDFVYPPDAEGTGRTCFYRDYTTEDGKPPCIWGQAFINLGQPVPERLEQEPISVVFYVMFGEDRPFLGDIEWATRVQKSQDSGHSWGVAVSSAEKAFSDEEV